MEKRDQKNKKDFIFKTKKWAEDLLKSSICLDMCMAFDVYVCYISNFE